MSNLDNLIKIFSGRNDISTIDLREALLFLEVGFIKLNNSTQGRHLLVDLPEREMINFAIQDSISSYWPNLALQWLEEKNDALTIDMIEILNLSRQHKWATQEYKHRLYKLIKRQ